MSRIKNVKNTTKFKRSIKAISPVIATLLMIAIAVVASLVVYAWVTGYMGNTTSKAGKAIQIQSFASSGGNLVVYVQNVGQGDVELDKDQSIYVNSNLVSFTSATQRIPISVGQTVELQTNAPYTAGTKVNIKVTTTDGTFMTTTGTGISTTNPSPTNPPVQYQIAVTQTANGAIAPGTTSYDAGSTPSFTITPDAGYHIASVTTNAGGQALTSPYVFPALSADGTLTATFEVDAAVATKLAFSAGGAQSLTVNTVSGAIVVQRQDVSSNPVSTGTSAITVTLTSSGTGTFYSDAAGTTAITSIQIAAGSSSSTGFYYKATVVGTGSHTLTGAFASLTSATTAFTISAANPVATKLVFSAGAAQTLTAGVVSPTAIVVQRQDASNAPVSIGTSATTVALSTGSSGAFYSDAAGTTVITSITIAAGSSNSAGFYYKDTVASTSRTLTGASNGLTSATTNFVINAGTATKLAFTVAPTTVVHHAISTVFTVQIQDAYGNAATRGSTTTVTLTDNDLYGVFYSDSAGNNVITSINIASGSSTANFYWEHDRTSNTGQYTITATPNGGLASALTNINVT